MRKTSAVAGSALFFIAAPSVVAGLAPWLLIGGYRRPFATPVPAALGFALVVAGLAVLLPAFGRFALEGRGTPAPVAPTERLVIGGVYRFVRNPMYLAVVAIIFGQALLFGSWLLAGYGALAAAVMATFVRFHEEPTLAARYGSAYDAYRSAVPAWLPRLTPWRGGSPDPRS